MVTKKIDDKGETRNNFKVLSAKSGYPATKASLVLAQIRQKRKPILQIPQKYVEKIVEVGNPQERYTVKPVMLKKSRSNTTRQF